MSASKDFFGTQHSFANAEHAALYRSLGGFLQHLLVRQFDVPQEDAELLVWETFHVYYDTKVPVPNERAWLISSACTIATIWLENRGLPAANEAAIARTAGKRLSYREARELLTERAQKALRLRFEEKKDYPEIAAELGVSTFMAKRYVKAGVAKLRAVLRGGTRQP